MMTEQEKKVVEILVGAWNAFLELPVEHSDDTSEFRHHLHILQRQVLARTGRREINEVENHEIP